MAKCPKCSRKFADTKNGYILYEKHYAKAHMPKKKKDKKKAVYKVPGFAKKRKR